MSSSFNGNSLQKSWSSYLLRWLSALWHSEQLIRFFTAWSLLLCTLFPLRSSSLWTMCTTSTDEDVDFVSFAGSCPSFHFCNMNPMCLSYFVRYPSLCKSVSKCFLPTHGENFSLLTFSPKEHQSSLVSIYSLSLGMVLLVATLCPPVLDTMLPAVQSS